MRAAVYRSTGPAREVLAVEDVPDPVPGPGQVRVEVRVSGVNPTDVKERAAPGGTPWRVRIPHQDGAGVVDAVGPGVDPARVGGRVWMFHAAYGRPEGSAAELVCLPEQQAVPLPDGMTFTQAASLGIPFITAAYCLDVGGPLVGRRVLVTGGAGAVGSAALQLARRAGARTISTVSSEEKAELARAAGADVVLDYRRPDHREQLVAAVPEGIDHVVDVALEQNLAVYAPALAPRSHVSSYASTPEPTLRLPLQLLRQRNVTLTLMLVYELAERDLTRAVRHVADAVEEGLPLPLPEHRFTLAQVGVAHETVERGVVGRVLIDVAG